MNTDESMITSAIVSSEADLLQEVNQYSAHNYHPLPVVLTRGEGVWVWDVNGERYLDCLAAYSAVNQGHRHPAIIAAAADQLERLTLTSRAFHNDQMGPFLKRLCELAGYERTLPMNTGAEAVETAIKAVRRWGYQKKGIPAGQAEIIVCGGNFHGRTTTIVSFSTDEAANEHFGPWTPGFKIIPYGDVEALAQAITPHTAGFLVEPLQGEGGVIVPPTGYLAAAETVCKANDVLLVVDEIQTGFGRTGKMFCSDWDGVHPDVMVVGKALSGGVYPVSAMLADSEVMKVFQPGDHGSTYGGNPLGAAIALAALDVVVDEGLADRANELGEWFMNALRDIDAPCVVEVRGRGLMIGVEIEKSYGRARPYCEALRTEGVLAKETHEQVIRFAPPLVIDRETLEWALAKVSKVLRA